MIMEKPENVNEEVKNEEVVEQENVQEEQAQEEVSLEEKAEEKLPVEKQLESDEANKKASLSTKETKEVLKLVFAFIKTLKQAKENDGTISATDLALLVNMFPHVGDAIDGIDQVIPELKDLDAKEVKDLMVYSGAQLGGVLGVEDQVVLEKALNAGIAVVELVALIIEKKK